MAINDLSDPKHLALLLKYDSVQGRFKGTVEPPRRASWSTARRSRSRRRKTRPTLPWKKLRCQVALESTGRFTNRASLQKHIDAGAERVILSAPAKDKLDATIVLGVNDTILTRTTGSSRMPRARPTAWHPWRRSCTRHSASRRA